MHPHSKFTHLPSRPPRAQKVLAFCSVLSKICHNEMLSVATKYGVNCLKVSDTTAIKLEIWKSFLDMHI